MINPKKVPAPLVNTIDLVALYFPGIVITIEFIELYSFATNPTLAKLTFLVLTPYLLPLLSFRSLTWIFPLKEGREYVKKGSLSVWFLTYRIQLLYGLLPALEGVLLAFPGLFSLWLRAWGSNIGSRVFWAATVKVTDRSHLIIGDNVFIGNEVYFSPHVVSRGQERNFLYYRRITIEKNCFIGAGCRMGPGVRIKTGSKVPALTDLYLNETFPPGDVRASHG